MGEGNLMLAFEVTLDDGQTIRAGVEDWSILALHVTASRGGKLGTPDGDRITINASGLTVPNDAGISHHFRWPGGLLDIGSVIVLKVVEADAADAPAKRYRSDNEVRESAFTEEEQRQMRYDDYLALKKEFESQSP